MWNLDTRMHVASVSKLMTAIGTVKLLDEHDVSLDSRIAAYYPFYWAWARTRSTSPSASS